MLKKSAQRHGFTLIELLIVIIIIGILAGVVLVVLNPARAQRKSAESVLKANTNKMCLALLSCAAAAPVDKCNSLPEMGIADTNNDSVADISGTPTGSVYWQWGGSGLIRVVGQMGPANGSAYNCGYVCGYNFDNASPYNLREYPDPLIAGWDCLID